MCIYEDQFSQKLVENRAEERGLKVQSSNGETHFILEITGAVRLKFHFLVFVHGIHFNSHRPVMIRYDFFLPQCRETRQVAPSLEVSGHLLSDGQSVRDP
jgi:hypothetical protein